MASLLKILRVYGEETRSPLALPELRLHSPAATGA